MRVTGFRAVMRPVILPSHLLVAKFTFDGGKLAGASERTTNDDHDDDDDDDGRRERRREEGASGCG